MQEQCNLLNLTINCPSDGAFNAKIAIVSEYPGENEVRLKRPMMGGAGRLLWDALKKINISRNEVYVTNVVKRQLSFAGGNVKKAISSSELQHWESILQWELGNLPNLEIILILGGLPLRALLQLDGINNWRGSILTDIHVGVPPHNRVVSCLCANNPAAALRSSAEELPFRFHIGKLKRLLLGEFKKYEITPHYNLSPKENIDWLERLHIEAVHPSNPIPIAFDIETMGGETACFGFSNNAHEGVCINLRTRDSNIFSLTEERLIYRRVQRLLGDKRIRFIAQNGNFDSYWIWFKDRLRLHRVWLDTMLAHHFLYPRLPHGLGWLTSQYTDHPFYKDEGKDWKEGGNIDQFWEYNIKDTCITWEVARRLLNELKAAGMSNAYFNHVMRIQPHLVRMTVEGVRVDAKLKMQIAEEMEEGVSVILNKFHNAVHIATGDYDYNPLPSSPNQMQKLYFASLRLVGRGTSTDAANRKRMFEHKNTSEAAKNVILLHNEYARESKFLSTYANMRIDPDERVRCEYKQIGVQSAPGRLSSSGVMWGSGMNLQNQPDRARRMFIADPGCCLCYFDLSQAEARVVAYLADIPSWKEQFERARLDGSFDCHRALASELFKIPYEDVPEKDIDEDGNHTIRYTAKRCRHGLNYRMEIDKLAETAGLSLRDATIAFHAYHHITPQLREWWDRTIDEFLTNKKLETIYGRRILLTGGTPTEDDLKSIVAFRPQSTIGDKVCEVLYQCQEDPEWPSSASMKLNVHDALIAQCPFEDAPIVLRLMKKHAESPLVINREKLIIPAELGISQPDDLGIHRWSTIKKIKSPEDAIKAAA